MSSCGVGWHDCWHFEGLMKMISLENMMIGDGGMMQLYLEKGKGNNAKVTKMSKLIS